MGIGKLCCFDALLIGRVKLSVAYVVHNGTCKQIHILKDYTERSSQIGFLYLVYVYSVISYLSVFDVVKAVDKVCYRCLSGSGRSDKSDLLPRLRPKGYIVKHGLAFFICKIHIEEPYISLELGICQSSVTVRMLPSPEARVLAALGQLPVFISLCIDQRNIAVIFFRLFIHKLKYSAGACKSHHNRRKLLGDVVDVARKLFADIEERNDYRYGYDRAEGSVEQSAQ